MMRPPHAFSEPVVLDTVGVQKQIHIFQGCEGWAFVELWSIEMLPFRAYLLFSAGQVSRPLVSVSVPRGYTSICLPSSSVLVHGERITNNAPPTVQACVSSVDRPIPTANCWITEHTFATAGFETIAPAFGARLVQIEPNSVDPATRVLCVVRIKNSAGIVLGEYTLSDIPSEGLELGEAENIEVQYTVGQVARIVWRLRF